MYASGPLSSIVGKEVWRAIAFPRGTSTDREPRDTSVDDDADEHGRQHMLHKPTLIVTIAGHKLVCLNYGMEIVMQCSPATVLFLQSWLP